ncbi:MAG: homoserine dehydrogenase [Spirochaetes bacterium]|nr:homoserine dehydrogenase [Spirochaetota bacterium]
MKRKVKIGLVGFGTVGSGVYELIKKNGAVISKRTDIELEIKTICDLRLDYVKETVSNINLTTNWKDLLEDDEIETIVELIGGIEPARTIIIEALKAGKNIVTANKKLLAEAGTEIFELSNKKSAKLGFEASVGGGIPCLQALKSGLVGNRIDKVAGILNGTTNYILTKMEEDGLSFAESLAEAQKLGFAEADPTFDIEGYDAGHKITLLSMLAFNKNIDYKSVEMEGITKLETIDTEYARSMGYAVKLLGIAKRSGNGVDISVRPTLIHEEHPLASVRNEFNAIMFENDMTGPVFLYGKGAGSLPTASAVVSDVIQIALKSDVEESAITIEGNAEIVLSSARNSRYYLRIFTDDKPGILQKLAGALAENNVSISSLVQEEYEGDHVPLLFITHEANEAGIKKSIEKINTFDFIKKPVMMIRIED